MTKRERGDSADSSEVAENQIGSEARALQAEADCKATLDEFWQGIYEEGQEQGDRDAADGRHDRYLTAVEALKFHPQFPYWLGYVEGYEGHAS
jgi:hypothetical protein